MRLKTTAGLGFAVLCIGIGSISNSLAQETQGATPFTRPSGVTADPPRTTRGEYTGSWYLRDRSAKVAIWITMKGNKPKVRYRYELSGGGAYGDSNDTGKGDSLSGVGPGTFTFTYSLGKDDVLRGRMVREWKNGSTTVSESNDFYTFRTDPGDQLFLRFLNYQRETIIKSENGQPPLRKVEPLDPTALTLERASDEIVHWEELPFSL